MNKAVFSLALACSLFSSAAFGASGASLTDVSGKVLVNKGEGFVPATGSMTLSAGDKVLVGEGSFAVLSYADCAVSVSKPSVVTVAGKNACEAGPIDASIVQPVAEERVGSYLGQPGVLVGTTFITFAGLMIAGVFDLDDDSVSGP